MATRGSSVRQSSAVWSGGARGGGWWVEPLSFPLGGARAREHAGACVRSQTHERRHVPSSASSPAEPPPPPPPLAAKKHRLGHPPAISAASAPGSARSVSACSDRATSGATGLTRQKAAFSRAKPSKSAHMGVIGKDPSANAGAARGGGVGGATRAALRCLRRRRAREAAQHAQRTVGDLALQAGEGGDVVATR